MLIIPTPLLLYSWCTAKVSCYTNHFNQHLTHHITYYRSKLCRLSLSMLFNNVYRPLSLSITKGLRSVSYFLIFVPFIVYSSIILGLLIIITNEISILYCSFIFLTVFKSCLDTNCKYRLRMHKNIMTNSNNSGKKNIITSSKIPPKQKATKKISFSTEQFLPYVQRSQSVTSATLHRAALSQAHNTSNNLSMY